MGDPVSEIDRCLVTRPGWTVPHALPFTTAGFPGAPTGEVLASQIPASVTRRNDALHAPRTIAGVATVYFEAEGAVRVECQMGRDRCGRALVGLLLRSGLPTFRHGWMVDKIRPDMIDERAGPVRRSATSSSPTDGSRWRPGDPWPTVRHVPE